jgi:hypothetical protein
VASKIVWPEMNSDHGTGLFDHDPGGGISDGKDSLVSFSPSGPEVILHTVSQLFGDKHYLCAFSAFGVPDSQLLIIHIQGGKPQDLAYPHTTPSHELQHGSVAHLGGSEDDLVNDFLFVNLPLCQLSRSKELFQHGGIAGILELVIQIVADKIEEGLEIGVACMLGELLAGIVEAG